MKTKLVASCEGTLEAAEKLINEFFYSTSWKVYDRGDKWDALNTIKGRSLSDLSMGLELKKR